MTIEFVKFLEKLNTHFSRAAKVSILVLLISTPKIGRILQSSKIVKFEEGLKNSVLFTTLVVSLCAC